MDNPTSPASVTKEKSNHWIHRYRKLVICVSTGLLLAVMLIYLDPLFQGNIRLTTLGYDKHMPLSMNNHGQIVGFSGWRDDHSRQAFFWDKRDGIQYLGAWWGKPSVAHCINDKGQVVGYFTLWNSSPCAFIWSKEKGMRYLGSLNGVESVATYINNNGEVVGYSHAEAGGVHAFLWTEENGMQDIGALDAGSSKATYINNEGQVVGHLTPDVWLNKGHHAFLWSKEKGMRDLGTLVGEHNSIPTAINNKGQIVGQAYTEYGKGRAFRWTEETGMQDIGSLGGDSSRASSINDKGYIVGGSKTKSGQWHAFLWSEEKGIQGLETFGGSESDAISINNKGRAVGVSSNKPIPFWWENTWEWVGKKLNLPNEYRPTLSNDERMETILWTIPPSEKQAD